MKKYLIALLVIILIIIGAGVIYWKLIKPTSTAPDQIACTQDGKVCPDGSVVGRQGPNCEFEECPFTPDAIDETAGWKTYTNDKYGFEFKYPESYLLSDDCDGKCLSLGIRSKPLPPRTYGTFPVLIISSSKYAYPYNGDIIKFVTEQLYSPSVVSGEGIKNLKIEAVNLGRISGAKVTASREDGMGIRSESQMIYGIDPKNESSYFVFGFWQYKADNDELNNFTKILSSVKFN